MVNLKSKKIIFSIAILFMIIASLIGYRIFAVDSNIEKIKINFNLNNGLLSSSSMKCRAATELHTDTCIENDPWSYPSCTNLGYTAGETITYGSLVSGDELVSGNAFDCDVDGNGEYDSVNERFYYVTDLETDPNYAVLIWANTSSNVSYSYGNSVINGPIEAMYKIPRTSEWENIKLTNVARPIVDQNGNVLNADFKYKPRFGTDTDGTPIYDSQEFAGRFLTYNEIKKGCNITSTGQVLDNKCNYLYENSTFTKDNTNYPFYIYLENLYVTSDGNTYNMGLSIESGTVKGISLSNVAVRPTIEVNKKNLALSTGSNDETIIINKNSTIDLNEYEPEWDNVKNNSYADFEGWQCKTNAGEYKDIGSDFSAASYPECIDSNGSVEIKATWGSEYTLVDLYATYSSHPVPSSIDEQSHVSFKAYHKYNYDLSKYKAKKSGYKLIGYAYLDDPYKVGIDLCTSCQSFKNFNAGYPSVLNNTNGGRLYLYAVWDEAYSIFYTGSFENERPEEIVYAESEYFNITTLKPFKNGYKFLGWSYSTDDTVVRYESGSSVLMKRILNDKYTNKPDPGQRVNLYPVWEKVNTLIFDANGGSGAPPSSEFYISDNVQISSQKPIKTGYTFTGWSNTQNGNVIVNAGDTISGETLKSYVTDNQLTLYAKWTVNKYTVNFNANGGSVSPTSKSVAYDGTYGDLPTPTKVGYTFTGWYTDTNYTTQVNSSTKVTITSNQTLYAKWTVNKYTVSFNANGGSVSPASKSVTYDGTYGDLPTPTRTGYTFNGWYTNNTDGTKIISSSTISITANQTLYARWSANTYTVSFDANGGSVSPVSKSVTYDGTYGDLPTSAREGYEFIGWFTSKDSGTKIENSTKVTIMSNQTLYAHWNKIYSINFDANGGSGAPNAFNTTNTITISSTIPSKEGFAFAGWQLDKNSSTVYNVGDNILISNIPSGLINGATINFYAKWSEIYTLTFDANGGAGAPTSIELKNIKGTLPSTVPEKDGYIFKGWAYENNASQEIYKFGANYDVSKIPSNYISSNNVINLYAVWGKKYIINFDANGGSGAPSRIETLATGSLPETIPKKEGYNFKGWSLTSEGEVWRSSKGYYDLSTMGLENSELTLYASWQKTSSNIGDTTITIIDEIIDGAIADIVIEEIYEDNNAFINIRNKVNNRLNSKVTKLKVYNIYLVNDKNEKIQPTKSITLELSLPKDYTNNIIVYRMEDNNKLTKLNSTIENNKIKFSTDHFSYYSIVEVDSNENANELDKPSNEDGIVIPTDNFSNNSTNDNNSNNINANSINNNSNNGKDEFENPETGITVSVVMLMLMGVLPIGIKHFVKKKEVFRKL